MHGTPANHCEFNGRPAYEVALFRNWSWVKQIEIIILQWRVMLHGAPKSVASPSSWSDFRSFQMLNLIYWGGFLALMSFALKFYIAMVTALAVCIAYLTTDWREIPND